LFFLEAKREKDSAADDGSGAPAGVKAPAGKKIQRERNKQT